MIAPRVRAAPFKAATPQKDAPKPRHADEAVAAPKAGPGATAAHPHGFAGLPIQPPSLSTSLSGPGLTIGAVDDPLEREADATASRILQMPEQGSLPGLPLPERRSAMPTARAGSAPPIVRQVLGAPGQPLSPAARAFFEPRFGHDLSRIRIHADARAGDSARAVHARAYTAGHQIVFGPGEYSPVPNQLLAHELAHVLQQPASPILRRQPKKDKDDSATQVDPAAVQATSPGGSGAHVYTYTATASIKAKDEHGNNQTIPITLPLLVYSPDKLDASKPVDVVVFFHGMRATYGEETPDMEKQNQDAGYDKNSYNASEFVGLREHLQDAANASGRVIVVPQGPTTWVSTSKGWKASSGNWTEALAAEGFDGLVDKALDGLTKDLKLGSKPAVGGIHVVGHSAGGKGLVESVSTTGAAKYRDKIQDITLQDAGYGGPRWDKLVDWLLEPPAGKTIRVLMSEPGGAKGAASNVNTRAALDNALNAGNIRSVIKAKQDAAKKAEASFDEFQVDFKRAPDRAKQQGMPLGFYLESSVTIENKTAGVTQGTIVAFRSATAQHYPTTFGATELAARSGPNDTENFLSPVAPGKFRAISPGAGPGTVRKDDGSIKAVTDDVNIFTDNRLRKVQLKVPTGTPLDVTSVDAKNPERVEVKLADGTTGWMKAVDLAPR